MEAVHTSETSVYYYETTWRFVPESCHLHARRCEDLKSHNTFHGIVFIYLSVIYLMTVFL
jgi:hypothetical protein